MRVASMSNLLSELVRKVSQRENGTCPKQNDNLQKRTKEKLEGKNPKEKGSRPNTLG